MSLQSWLSARRICTERFFDRYFLLEVPPQQVSEAVIKQIVNASSNKTALLAILEDLRTRKLILDALERLEAEESLKTLQNPVPFISALADIADFLPRKKVIFMKVSAEIYARRALLRALNKMPSQEAKKNLIDNLVKESKGLCCLASWIQSMEKRAADSDWPQLTGQELEQLKQRWLVRAREAANSGELLNIEELNAILWFWHRWGDATELKAWGKHVLQDERSAVRLLCALVSESSSQSLGSYHVEDNSWMDLERLLDFCSLEEWREFDRRLESKADFTEKELRAIRLFKKAIAQSPE
jgi:predicted KAP-like P-loop ATPase